MTFWKTTPSLQDLKKRCENTLMSHLKISFVEVGDNYLKVEMPMGPHLMQPMGIMHGGVSCVLAETVGTAAASHCVDPKTHCCVGLDINTNHIKTVKSGVLTATAKPYHIGKRTQVWEIEIRNEEKNLISVSRLTVMVLEISSL